MVIMLLAQSMLLIEMQIVEETVVADVSLDVVVGVVVDKITHRTKVMLSQKEINNNNNHHNNSNYNNKVVVNRDNKDNVVVMMILNHVIEATIIILIMKVHLMVIKIKDAHVAVVDISVADEDVVVVDLEEVVVADLAVITFNNKEVHSVAVISKIDQEYLDVDHQ